MPPTDRELMQRALWALATADDFLFTYHECEPNNEREMDAYSSIRARNHSVFAALRERLAQPEQEPVGTVKELFTIAAWERLDVVGSTKVYLGTPPAAQRQWIGLTDEERRACAQSPFVWENYLAIEAKLKEKNT